jgi:Protein of unknown function (DUF1345)/NHL repeat
MLIGTVFTAVMWHFTTPPPARLMGWDVAAVIYLVMVWAAVSRRAGLTSMKKTAAYLDFAYFSFTIGMTFQVSDTSVDANGNLVLARTTVRVVAVSTGTFYGQAMTAGDTYTIAGGNGTAVLGDGGPATAANLNASGVALDPAGDVVIADFNNGRIRLVGE